MQHCFLYKKSEVAEAVKSIFWIWLNTTSDPIKRLHTHNGREYITSELQFFLREQGVIYETSTLHIHQQNSHTEQLNCILLEKTQSMQLEAYLPYSW